PISTAVVGVSSGLGDQVDLTVAGEAKFGGRDGGLNTKLLDGIDVGRDDHRPIETRIVGSAIHDIAVKVPAPAVDRKTISIGGAAAVDTGSEGRKLEEASSIERQC